MTVTELDEDDVKNVAQFCPGINTLPVRYCGRLSPATTEFYARHLRHLQSITLHGPFLVTDSAFSTLVSAVAGQLRVFSVSHSARLSSKTVAALAGECRRLEELTLRDCNAVSDADILK